MALSFDPFNYTDAAIKVGIQREHAEYQARYFNMLSNNLATKQEIKEFRLEVKEELKEVKQEIKEFRSELKGDIQEIRLGLRDEISKLFVKLAFLLSFITLLFTLGFGTMQFFITH